MKIEYRDGGTLYVIATALDAIQKYASADAKRPKINKLGTQEWTKTKSRVRGAVTAVAKDLVELYAVRQSKEGYSFGKDTVWQQEFEEMFPFEETEDQLAAIAATKEDMESRKIMVADLRRCGLRQDGGLPSGQPSRQYRKGNRSFFWCLPPYLPNSLTIPSSKE